MGLGLLPMPVDSFAQPLPFQLPPFFTALPEEDDHGEHNQDHKGNDDDQHKG